MRAVFDTNVLVSALMFEQSTPARAFFAALQGGEVLLSAALANEISTILHRKKFDRYFSEEQCETFLIALVQSSKLVEVTETIQVCRDPKDAMLLPRESTAGQVGAGSQRQGRCAHYGGYRLADLESIQENCHPPAGCIPHGLFSNKDLISSIRP